MVFQYFSVPVTDAVSKTGARQAQPARRCLMNPSKKPCENAVSGSDFIKASLANWQGFHPVRFFQALQSAVEVSGQTAGTRTY